MKNIFSSAYFGKPYRTRNGKKAIYLFDSGCGVYCITEEFKNKIRFFHFNGIPYNFEFSKYRGEDIISECQEEINEEELDKLAIKLIHEIINDFQDGEKVTFKLLKDLVKAGYREAKKI